MGALEGGTMQRVKDALYVIFRAEKITRQSFGLAERMNAGILNLDACE